jgi:FAD-linked sulfhydryl oxidase
MSETKVLEECPPVRPRCWGPAQWQAIHQLLRGYPDIPTEATKQALRNYLEALVYLIPCPSCAGHWKEIVGTVDASSRVAALKWSIDVHNAVNRRLHKRELTYTEAIEALNQKCPHDGAYTAPPGFVPRALKTERAIMVAMIVILFVAVLVMVVVLVVGTTTKRSRAATLGNSPSPV